MSCYPVHLGASIPEAVQDFANYFSQMPTALADVSSASDSIEKWMPWVVAGLSAITSILFVSTFILRRR